MEAKFKIKLEVTRQVLCAFHMIFVESPWAGRNLLAMMMWQ